MAAENAAPQPALDAKLDAKGKKKAGKSTIAKAAGAGGYFLPPQAQVLQNTVQVPRRFPGHFMPHRLCNHWNLQGWCKKAETCTFAHGIEELHPDVQAQLLQQKPGMPPPTVTKDGRLVVHGVTKPAGKVTPEPPSYPVQTLSNVYGTQTSILTAGMPTAGGIPFSSTSFPFSVPPGANIAPAQSIGLKVPEEDEDGDSSPGTPSMRRPAPAPLSLDDISPDGGQAMMVRPSVLSPTSVGARYTVRTQPMPMASPMRVQVVSRPLPSPISTGLTPTGVSNMATSVAMAALATPKTAAVQSLASPARVTTHFTRTPQGNLIWPGSPTLLSPQTHPGTPVPIDRSTFLQARQVAVRMEQGPPGLAMWAPTPTTKAGLLGFRHPEPGYMSVQPRS